MTLNKKKFTILFSTLTLMYIIFIAGWFFFTDQYIPKELLFFEKYSDKYLKLLVLLVASLPAALWSFKILTIHFLRPVTIPKIVIKNNFLKIVIVFFVGLLFISLLELSLKIGSLKSVQTTKKFFHSSIGLTGMGLKEVRKLIDQELVPEKTFNVFLIGESNSAQFRSKKIQEKVNNLSGKEEIKFYNLSMPWHSSAEAIYKLVFYALNANPGLIILLPAINDLYRGCNDPAFAIRDFEFDYGNYLGPNSNMVRRNIRKNILGSWDYLNFKLLHKWFNDFRDLDNVAFKKFLPLIHDPNVIRSYKSFERNLNSFARVASTSSADIVFATSPTPIPTLSSLEQNGFKSIFGNPVTKCKINGTHVLSEDAFFRAYNKMYKEIKAVGMENNIEILDLRNNIEYEESDFSDLIHPRKKLLSMIESSLANFIYIKYQSRVKKNAF